MTGEEHYRAAQDLLAASAGEPSQVVHDRMVLRAGVHAQLAIASVYVTAEAKS